MIFTLLSSFLFRNPSQDSETLLLRKRGREDKQLYVVAELSKSNVFLLSDVYVINHWFLALIGAFGYEVLGYLYNLQNDCGDFIDKLLLIPYIWFAKQPRKPPDKSVKEKKVVSFVDSLLLKIEKIENTLYDWMLIDVDIMYWLFIASCIVRDAITSLITVAFSIKFDNEEGVEGKRNYFDEMLDNVSMKKVKLYQTINRGFCKRMKYGKIVKCNLIHSLSSRTNSARLDDIERMDSDSYHFAIDTCTSYSICKEKELFVGKIKSLNQVYIKGIGGKTKAEGYGTIKLRITDDDGELHDLEIHDVLYVPASPANLISPQRWSKTCHNPSGTGEITVGDHTLLFWDDQKYSKLVPHHPDLGIPIMSVNDGYTKWSAMMTLTKMASLYQPIMTPDMNTSKMIQNDRDEPNIIPIDDEDISVHRIEGAPNHAQYDVPNIIEADSDDESVSTAATKRSNVEETNDEAVDDDIEANESDSDSIGDNHIENDSVVSSIDESTEISQNEIDQLADDLKQTVSDDQRELMQYHLKLKHLPFSHLKKLAEKGIIPKRLAKVKPPLCHSCLMGKQHRKPWRGRGKKKNSIRKPHENFAGANTSTDQMISPFGGMIPQMKGRLMRAKYYAATIFVDHYTDYTYVHLMKDTTGESTLESKNAYESLMKSYGHDVRRYHADNGRYAENTFKQDVKDKAQQITYCGVGSHHQNGIAERRIKSLGEDARAMLSHGQHLWPEVISKKLWPYAYKAACRARNKYKLDDNNHSPEEKLSGIVMKQDIRHEHPLFCPVYALDKKLQGGIGGIPKWNPRSNAGVYLGHSPQHSSDVALVLNLNTGLVSPQYHVVFDDTFSTVEYLRSKKEPTNWENLCKNHAEDYTVEGNAPTNAIEIFGNHFPRITPTETTNKRVRQVQFGDDQVNEVPPNTVSEGEDLMDDQDIMPSVNNDDEFDVGITDNGNAPLESPDPVSATEGDLDGTTEPQAEIPNMDEEEAEPNRYQRPRRRKRATAKMMDPVNASLREAMGLITSLFIRIPEGPIHAYASFKNEWNEKLKSYESKYMFYDSAVQLNVDGSINTSHPFSFATQTAGNEVYHFHQAMQEPDRDLFIEAMIKELKDFNDNGFWELVPRSEIGSSKPIKAIWSFKRKRRPDGSLLKHKARLCAHGGMQVYGENYWDTYAPVVQWASIRMMLTLSVIHSLYTTCIDFTLAFPQAQVQATIYVELPLGCEAPEGEEYVMKLIKNVYGLRDASRTWFEYLRDSLIASKNDGGFDFIQSKLDPCIFYRDGVTIVIWVDDCLIFAKDKATADQLLTDLRTKFTLTEEDDVSSYLGVKMRLDDENDVVEMTQPFLIDKIIESLGDAITDANTKPTPAVYKEVLHKDEDGPERKQPWNYRSAIGMLNYLAASTRPDILYAVHQCARFAANPKLSHERALKRIVRYLKGTRDKGIILKPNLEEGVQCYVDADFAGGYSNETREQSVSVYSRTGYVIFYLGCPLLWVSKLQSEIALSTVEAEYIALSQSMRDIIPLQDLMQELNGIFGKKEITPNVHCKLFEDNNGALELARAPRYRPRTKHIAIKYHHFREHVANKKISIHAIDTKEQIADQFTKALQQGVFEYLRYKLLGW